MDSQGKAKVALTFALYQGDALVRRDTIVQDIVKVGKDPRSHLRVDDDLASRMHAVIEVASPGDITLIDLGNEPGTLVNGQRVNKCKIRPGDQIQIGSTLIQLENAEAAVVTSAAPPAIQSAPPAPVSAPPPPPSSRRPEYQQQEAAPNPFVPVPPQTNPYGAQAAPQNLYAPPPQANPYQAPPQQAAYAPPPPPAIANPFAQAAPPPQANPFVAQAVPAPPAYGVGPVPMDIDPNQPFTYQMVKSGPDVNPDEVEVPHLAAIEVMVMWDTNVLHVSHLTPPRSFYVGEEQTNNVACDYFIPSETLGTTRAPIVVARGMSAALVMLPRSSGYVDVPGQGRISFQDLISSGRARPSGELSGAHEYELPAGAKARMELEGSSIVFQVAAVNAGKPIATGMGAGFESTAMVYIGLSFLLHMGIVASLAFFMPRMSLDDSDSIDRDQVLMMQKYLDAAAEREEEEKETEQADNAADQKEGGTGTRAKGEEGSMGNPNTQATGHKFGVQGPQDNADPHIARQAALREAAEFGMIGLLNTGAGGDPNAPTAPWGREDSLGNDPLSARGNMWGDTIGDSFGAGGLGLSGVGEGGGGRGEGIGLGNIGTIGHGAGTGTGQGFGNGHGRLGGAHQTRSPSLRQGATQVNGRLPQEVIQRIVRQNFGRFRLCYENGLRTNPNLQGRVAVKFVIDRSGAVSTASDGGSDLPDQGVVSCVVRGFGNLSFPQPEGGIVTVVYPVIFSPGD